MRWFPAMFCHSGPSSLVFFLLLLFFFSGCQILSDSDLQIKNKKRNWRYIKYGELHWRLWLSQNCWLVLHTNFIRCRASFVLRCSYESALVVCAVARTVSPSVKLRFDLHWSFGFIEISPLTPSTRSKIQKKLFGFTDVPLKFISAPPKDKHFIGQLWQLMSASNAGAWTQAWQTKWAIFKIEGFACKRFFFPNPSLLFYLRHFSQGLWLLFLILCS